VSEDVITRFFEHLFGRVTGPMHLRLLMQPAMALFFAARAGLHDAKTGQTPYLWAMFTSHGHRRELLAQGWKDVGKVFVIALILDVVYQIITVRWIHPMESLLVSVTLAFLPYLTLRGLFTRLSRKYLESTMTRIGFARDRQRDLRDDLGASGDARSHR
jgi:hypothetical protein